MIDKAMILAAGLGKRAREVSGQVPKPMIEVGGKTLIERMIISLLEAGVKFILINTHYLAEMLESHIYLLIEKYKWHNNVKLMISRESELLETGGSVKANLSFFEKKPFFVVNCDIIWPDLTDILERLSKKLFNNPNAKLVLAVTELENISGLCKCDFFLENGILSREGKKNMVYTGLQLVTSEALKGDFPRKFSFNIIFDQLIEKEELYGVKFLGRLFHVGDKEGYQIAISFFQEQPKKVISK